MIDLIEKIVMETSISFRFLMLTMIVLGLRQVKSRAVPPGPMIIISCLMLGFSFYGMVLAFSGSVLSMGVWFFALISTFFMFRNLDYPRDWSFDPMTKNLIIPGSWLPLLLIIFIFALRLFVRYQIRNLSSLIHSSVFLLSISSIYGFLSGIFAYRTWHAFLLSRRK